MPYDSASAMRPWLASVRVKPGATALTVMPRRPSSFASTRVRPITPALLAT